jgi:hypothetical protein
METLGLALGAKPQGDGRIGADIADGTPERKEPLGGNEHASLFEQILRKAGSSQDSRDTDAEFLKLDGEAAGNAKVFVQGLTSI